MEKEPLTLEVKFKLKDVLRYNMSIAYRSIVSKGILVLGLVSFIYFVYKGITRTVSLDLFIAQHIVWLIIPFLILIAGPVKVWKITVAQMQQPVFLEGAKYTFYSEQIGLTVGEQSDVVPSSTYIRYVETKHDFRFFVDQVQAQLIPKHNLTHEQIESLREWIKDNQVDKG